MSVVFLLFLVFFVMALMLAVVLMSIALMLFHDDPFSLDDMHLWRRLRGPDLYPYVGCAYIDTYGCSRKT